jgi:16S rRNA processing protein RimM
LRNLKLYVSRAGLPNPEPNEFYHADLIGLVAVATDGNVLGTVLAVHNFGAGDLIEIKPQRGPTVMVPFTDAVVPTIDLAAGRLIVDPPAGAFDREQNTGG